MHKFIVKANLFFIPIIIILICLEIYLRAIPNDYIFKNNYLSGNSDNVQVLSLGSSHSYYGINPEYFDLVGFNGSHISQSIEYDYKLLMKYDGHWKNLKYIIISVSYFTFFSKLEEGAENWRVKNYSIYYDIKTSKKIGDYFELPNGVMADNIRRAYNYYKINKDNITCSPYGFGLNYNSGIKNDLTASGVVAAKRHTKKDIDKYFIENQLTLKKIIDYAHEKNITVILFTPPAYESYVTNLDKKQLEITIKTSEKLSQENNNVIYLNYLQDKSFVKNDFFDADHLNEIGAKKLTLYINSIINMRELSWRRNHSVKEPYKMNL